MLHNTLDKKIEKIFESCLSVVFLFIAHVAVLSAIEMENIPLI